ncbi:nuclear transport factor 2 family protein [Roseivirga sp. E12]|uniref:nuclear transport factor 2 family protein n=1 Tax=Roseivirga sp. E12 TaxID=2819237 RepID=UPI001ABD4052|nr:nuclear transport factor 2 family protein [Roseivirga sp. E12]MBO3698012.1 nuclear transport factor 2 family protein [Roseivirga sp. E12]
MRHLQRSLAVLIFSMTCSFISFGQEEKVTPKDSLIHIVNDYYRLNVIVFQSDSSPKDVENIFDLFTPDFVYVHPKYGGTYSRDDLYNGYLRNQKNGGYDGSVTDIIIANMITGLNAVTVTKHFVNKQEDGSSKKGEPQMTLFEFKGGKISKIFEYW